MDSEEATPSEITQSFRRELREAARLLKEGRLAEARVHGEEALALRPANLLGQNLLGLLLYQQGEHGKAQEVFEALVQRTTDVLTLRLNAGLAAFRNDDLPRAVEHFRRAVDLDPGHCRAFGYLALLHLAQGEHLLARAALLEAGLEEVSGALANPVDPGQLETIIAELGQKVDQLPPDPGGPPPDEGFAEAGSLWSESPSFFEADTTPVWATPEPPAPTAVVATPEQGALEPLLDADEWAAAPNTIPEAEPLELETRGESADGAEVIEAPPLGDAAGALSSPGPSSPDPSSESITIPIPRPASTAPRGAAAKLVRLVPAGLDQGPPVSLRWGMLLLRFTERAGRGDGAVVRSDHVLLERGKLKWTVAQRRRKGADQGPFLCDGAPVMHVSGAGSAVLHPGCADQLDLLELEEEGLFLRQRCLEAWSTSLNWENGRIPGAGPDGPEIVHLRGSGFVALRSSGRIWTVPVADEEQVRVQLDWLVGWSGDTVPEPVEKDGPVITVGFSGEGMLMLSLVKPQGV
jgi:uncharacterized protein (AIM24 family)